MSSANLICRLPFPESLKKLQWSWQPEEVVDDPEQHDGRLRSFPHERGNWASCVFVPISGEICLQWLLRRKLQSNIQIPVSDEFSKQLSVISDSFIEICRKNADLHAFPQYHISLSRTVVLRHHWINPLVDDIRKRISCIGR